VRKTPPPYGDTPPGGYRKRKSEDYDRTLCLLPRDGVDFVLATQPKEWQRLEQHHGKEAVREQFLRRRAAEIERRGALDVLRNGIKDSGCKFRLAWFRPASGLNEETRRLHAANLFAVVRQLHYSTKNEKSLDLVLFLNGLPVFTAELKNPLNGQDVEDAIRQYQTDRDPREPLLKYGRCLAHFAVDPDLVYVTTHLAGKKTRFLPFNQGKYGGAGNPPVPPTRKGYASAYLWEETWSRDSVLDLVRQFIHEVEEEDKKGRKTGRRFLIFPRYQQLDCVRRLVADARSRGPGQRYLIQHSAGSGKSFTIAWLAHQLATLHDATDRRVFDSIVVITDRRVLDRQLQATMRQFEQTLDVLANYATYKAYWRLLKKVEDDPRYDRQKAEYLLKSFVELHPHAINEKVRIMVEHCAAKAQGEVRKGEEGRMDRAARGKLSRNGRQSK
jgi:type I restriction enzyme R subunit